MGQVAANSGFGPPAISITESTNQQVFEEIRRRQLAAAVKKAAAPPPPPPVVEEEAAPEPAEAAPPAEAAAPAEAEAGPPPGPGAKPPPLPAEDTSLPPPEPPEPPKKTAKKPKKTSPVYIEAPSSKGFDEAAVREYVGTHGRRTAVWAKGFVGWERHSNLAPGQDENPTREQTLGGGMAGMDWTSPHSRRETIQVGVFGGGSAARNSYSNTTFALLANPAANAQAVPPDLYQRTGHSQDIDGGFLGGYLTYRKSTWLADLVFKTDFLDLSDKSFLTQANPGCMTPDSGTQRGSASLISYLVAANITERIPQGPNSWIGPTAGFRYTNTSFSDDTSVTTFTPGGGGTQVGTLGLDDGQALRLQAGVRFGGAWKTRDGVMWETEVGALLYSDVWVDGFNFTSTSGNTVTPVDEGKVRGLGQAMAKINMGNGVSYIMQGEVYGGEDLIGVDGQAGVRYEW